MKAALLDRKSRKLDNSNMSMEVGSSNAYRNSTKHSWWSTQTTKEKKLIIISAILSLLALIFVICTIALATRKPYELKCADSTGNRTADRTKICNTKDCRKTAFQIKINMNEDADPCHSFYEFACGGFDMVHEEGETNTKIAVADFNKRVQGTLKSINTRTMKDETNPALKMYKSCISQEDNQENELKAVKDLIKDILGTDWPVAVGNAWNETKFNLSQSLAKLVKMGTNTYASEEKLPTNFFLSFVVMPDTKDYKKLAAMLFGTELPLQIPSNLEDIVCLLYPDCKSNSLFDEEIAELKSLNQGSMYSSENASSSVKDRKVPEIMRSAATDVAKFKKYTIQQLMDHIPQIEWHTFFQTLFDETGYSMQANFEVMSDLEILKNTIEKYAKSKRLLANVIAFSLVKKFGPLLLVKQTPQQVLLGNCITFIDTYLGFALGKLYIDQYLSKESLTEIADITHALRAGFRKLIIRAPWIDKETQSKALEKVDNMKSVVASPAWVFNESTMKEYYRSVTDVIDKNFALSSRVAAENFFNQRVRQLNSAFDKENYWHQESPIVANAFYFQLTNGMYYPLGLLMNPFFLPGRPRAMKYGSFGYIAGHEVTHGFDSNGKDFDQNGLVNKWWDDETAEKFSVRSDCFVKQYSGIKDEQAGINLNGKLTLAENIADNGGLRAAYQAYKDAPEDIDGKLLGLETYTEDQLFFVSAAQSWCSKESKEEIKEKISSDNHSPDKYRAYVPFLNFPEFAKAFQCEEGTPMNPKIKCEIW